MDLLLKIIILIGCYQDSIKPRLLYRSASMVIKDNPKDKCLERCRWQRYPLAGLHNRMCLCGDTKIDDLKKYQIGEDTSNDCNGNLTMKVYQTGILSTANTFTIPSTLQEPGKTSFR